MKASSSVSSLAFTIAFLIGSTLLSSLVSAEQYGFGHVNYELDKNLSSRIKALDENPQAHSDISEVQKVFRSEAFTEKVNGYRSRGLEALGIDISEAEEAELKVLKGNKLIVFASSSVPLDTLRNYVDDLLRLDGVMVFKGTIGEISKLKPTIDYFRTIMVEDLDCQQQGCEVRHLKIAVDPKRFRQYGIEQVPAFVVESNPSFEPNCNQATDYDAKTNIIYGDASISSVLEELAKQDQGKHVAALQQKLMESR